MLQMLPHVTWTRFLASVRTHSQPLCTAASQAQSHPLTTLLCATTAKAMCHQSPTYHNPHTLLFAFNPPPPTHTHRRPTWVLVALPKEGPLSTLWVCVAAAAGVHRCRGLPTKGCHVDPLGG
jgi:hypothetical protein